MAETHLLTFEEVAARLRCSVRSVRRFASKGQLRVVRFGKRPLVTEAEVEAFIAAAFRRVA